MGVSGGVQRQKDATHMLPPALMRRYEVIITPRSLAKPLRMRQVQAATIGSLVTVRVWPPSWTPPPPNPCSLPAVRLCLKQRRSEVQSSAICRDLSRHHP